MMKKLLGSSLLFISTAHAEVSDKCMTFVSDMSGPYEQNIGFLSSEDALVRLGAFTVAYALVGAVIYLVLRLFKSSKVQYLPLAYATLLSALLLMYFIPGDDPCGDYHVMKEMSTNLALIQSGFYVVLIINPVVVFLALRKKFKSPAA